jgi:hypothetical protein
VAPPVAARLVRMVEDRAGCNRKEWSFALRLERGIERLRGLLRAGPAVEVLALHVVRRRLVEVLTETAVEHVISSPTAVRRC